MPKLSFPCTQAGLTLTVVIGVNGQTTADLLAKGEALPPPVQALALVDTGTDITCVDARLLAQLGLVPVAHRSTHTVSGPVRANFFEVSLTIFGSQGATGPAIVHDQFLVMELPHSLPNLDALLGLDVLWDCKLLLDGPARVFSLEF